MAIVGFLFHPSHTDESPALTGCFSSQTSCLRPLLHIGGTISSNQDEQDPETLPRWHKKAEGLGSEIHSWTQKLTLIFGMSQNMAALNDAVSTVREFSRRHSHRSRQTSSSSGRFSLDGDLLTWL